MHIWGDRTFDWESLDQAIQFFPKWFRRLARCTCFAKEKWGALSLEHWYPYPYLHTLFMPHKILNIPKWWPMQFDCNYWSWFLNKTKLIYLFLWYQKLIFNVLCLIMYKKWPHIKDEMFHDYEFKEWMYGWVKRKVGFKDSWGDLL